MLISKSSSQQEQVVSMKVVVGGARVNDEKSEGQERLWLFENNIYAEI